MLWLMVRNAITLWRTGRMMHPKGLDSLVQVVKTQPVVALDQTRTRHYEEVCRSIDLLCAFWPRRVLCLQRSVATAIILKRHGWAAHLIIGVQTLPFASHAWVEIEGVVVNDKPYMREIYRVFQSAL